MPDIFDQEDTADYLSELTKPGAKFDRSRYKDDTELLKAIAKSTFHADKFIATKNEQFDQLREDYMKLREDNLARANLEDFTQRKTQNDNTNTNVNSSPPLDAETFKKIANEQALSAYAQIEAQKKQEANLSIVDTKLKERFGEKSREILRERMSQLNLSQDDVKFLASKSPDAVIGALGLNAPQQQTYDAPPRSSINSDSFKPTTTARDALYYEDLRREKPKEYYSEKVSVQRLKDMDSPDFMKRFYERAATRTGGY